MPITREPVEIATPGEKVPGVLMRPATRRRVPGALLLHGLSSTKERMADSIGQALAERGIASLAIDLPLHGSRQGDLATLSAARPFGVIGKWKLAVTDSIAALDFVAASRGVDGARLAIVGYSLGAFLGVQLAAHDARIEGVVLAAGGDLPDNVPFERLARTIADPVKAIGRLNKPVLMINGQFDRTVTPPQARRLHEAAQEPKTIRWYRGGHWPPPAELDAAADWLASLLGVEHRRAG